MGILGKVPHSTPYQAFQWDMARDQTDLGQGRNPEVYYQYAKNFVQDAIDGDRPFFFMANSHDPHRPFYGNDKAEWYSRTRSARRATFAHICARRGDQFLGFLPDIPDVRLEIAEYYNSVRRCDDTVGRLLDVLDEMGVAENTLVMFLSDNGMAFPFAKTNCYLNSTRTPLGGAAGRRLFRPGAWMPSILFRGLITCLPCWMQSAWMFPRRRQWSNHFCRCCGVKSRLDASRCSTQFHQTSARSNYPMRCVQNARFGYIFNPLVRWRASVSQ